MRCSLDAFPTATLFGAVSALVLGAGLVCGPGAAVASPALTMDVATGEVLYQQEATRRWFPASTTKLMTVYVALSAVREHKVAMDTPLVYSARARAMPPSKMGFAPGTQVTLDNALRMLMVRSANDVAVTVAEGISGSVEAFADDMNRSAAELGMNESHFVNPNGLPNPDHYSSARDMGLLARALYTQFPDQAALFDIGALQFGSQIIPNHNNLLGRYPGADGMKTGFTCAAGFNVVASAFRDGRRIVTVVMGAPSVATRTAKVAALLDRAFANVDRPGGSIISLPSSGGAAPDVHNQVCRNRGPLVAQFNAEVVQLDAGLAAPTSNGIGFLNPERAFLFNTPSVAAVAPTATRINSMPRPQYDLVPVHIGADVGYQGPVAEARAPHSPIGSESVPATAEAYAPATVATQGVGIAPLAVDPHALHMHGGLTRAAARHRGRANALAAAAEAPKTKVLAGADGDDAAPAKTAAAKTKHTAKHGDEKKHVATADNQETKRAAPDDDEKPRSVLHADAKKRASHSEKAGAAKSGAGKSAAAKPEAGLKTPAKKTKSAEDE